MIRIASVVLIVLACGLAAAADDGARRGVELLRAGDYEAALVALRDAQIENPDSPWLHFNIGLALYKLERWDEASTAFSSALFARDPDIEKRAELHLGNCAFQQGKLKEALDHYNRALVLDEGFENAKVNREFVTRKLKELARKKKDQQEEQEKQRKIIEKLQELIKEQVALHAGVRRAMAQGGTSLAPTSIEEFAGDLDFEMPEDAVEERTEEDDEKILVAVGEQQEAALAKLRELLVEVRAKIEAGKAAGGQPGAPGAAPTPPAGAPPVDPAEVAKLEKAVPFLAAAEPAMDRARTGALESLRWPAVHAGQEEALAQLLKALRELLDELTKIIQDQVQLLKGMAGTAAAAMTPDETRRLEGDALLDSCVQHASTEEKLRERTTAFAMGVEQQLEMMRQQATPDPTSSAPQPGTHPGQVPEEQLKRIEKAVSHLNKATVEMETTETQLEVPAVEESLGAGQRALEELIKARAMLSPPQEQQDKNQKGDQGEQDKEQEKQDGEDQEKPDENKKEGEDEGKPDQGGEGSEEESEQKEQKEQRMSEEQARKMLEQARQGERDRRREEREKAKRARGVRRGGVKKDW